MSNKNALIVRLDEDTKKSFKLRCVKLSISQQEVLMFLIKKWLKKGE